MVCDDEEGEAVVGGALGIGGLEAGNDGGEIGVDVFAEEDYAADFALASEGEEGGGGCEAGVGVDDVVGGEEGEVCGGVCCDEEGCCQEGIYG